MIRLTDDRRKVPGVSLGAILVGNSHDEAYGEYAKYTIGGVLNVAQDMEVLHRWRDGMECMHVGLCDGPGNEPAAYCAAVLALHALIKRHNVLVCCHSGGRSLAVAMMYMNAAEGSGRGWSGWLGILGERVDDKLPVVHEEHIKAFDKIDWKLLKRLM